MTVPMCMNSFLKKNARIRNNSTLDFIKNAIYKLYLSSNVYNNEKVNYNYNFFYRLRNINNNKKI